MHMSSLSHKVRTDMPIGMTEQNQQCIVKCIYHHLKNKNNFESVPFSLMMLVIFHWYFQCHVYTDSVDYSAVIGFVLVGQQY